MKATSLANHEVHLIRCMFFIVVAPLRHHLLETFLPRHDYLCAVCLPSSTARETCPFVCKILTTVNHSEATLRLSNLSE